jgi:hypothetical protein
LLFAGFNIFGVGVASRAIKAPRRRQYVGYPNVDGVDVIDLGGEGGVVEVSGRLVANSLGLLAAAEAVWRAYENDPSFYPLVDTAGVTWPYAMCDSFEPVGEYYVDPTGAACRDYRAVFRILA